jgi:hypothetical protein
VKAKSDHGPGGHLGWEFRFLGSDFWDPHCKRNSDSVFDSKDSGRKILFKFRCLESQKIRIVIPKYGILVPHKKTDTYSSVDTKVHGRKP